MPVSLDRFEFQTRSVNDEAVNAYAVWLRYESVVEGESVVSVKGPMTPEEAEAKGFPLDAILGSIGSAQASEAVRLSRELADKEDELTALRAENGELMAELNRLTPTE